MLWPAFGASFPPSALAWSAASGIASAAAFALLYRTLAIGPMSVLSPVTALVSAALPVSVGLLQGDQVGAVAFCGVALALVAVVVITGGTEDRGRRPTRTALAVAFGAGAAIALQLVCLAQAPADSGVAPLLVGRAVSSAVVLGAALALRTRLGSTPPSVADLCRCPRLAGELRVPAGGPRPRPGHRRLITALYPASTVLLARVVLGERIGSTQLAGLGLAAVAVSLLALG